MISKLHWAAILIRDSFNRVQLPFLGECLSLITSIIVWWQHPMRPREYVLGIELRLPEGVVPRLESSWPRAKTAATLWKIASWVSGNRMRGINGSRLVHSKTGLATALITSQ